MVIWITGLSGAGKTTIAREIVRLLHERQWPVVMLDGDDVREAIDDPQVGHDRASRLANAMRIARLAELVARQGVHVVVPTMSLFSEVHQWNREHLPEYFEVYIKVGMETLRQRDPRGLYRRADRGEARNVAGIDLAYDEPANPRLVLDHERTPRSIQESAKLILKHAMEGDQVGKNGMGLHEASDSLRKASAL